MDEGFVGTSEVHVHGTVGGHVRRGLGWSEEHAATGYACRGDASAGDAGVGTPTGFGDAGVGDAGAGDV